MRSVAEAVEQRLGYGKAFLDEWYEHYISGFDAELRLQGHLSEPHRTGGVLHIGAAIESMLRETVRHQHVEDLRRAMATLASADIPPISMEEIETS